ncbi:unnamed protein product [Arabis nemorensis]|uniref:RNase H type-1 domain-containing protein n=1 Tax=Arabis nemorensis TaxID=586526 RepID=A0A565CLN8_9BRAS|nr:unnamed protein product [Arabis nemorensis]
MSATRPHVASVLVAETLAMKRALEEASVAGFKELNMFSVSQVLIFLINSGGFTIELKGLLHDISLLRISFEAITFNYISRLNNATDDSLAKTSLISFPVISFDGE